MKPIENPAKLSPVELASSEEPSFYSDFGWCLSPILNFADLLIHLREETDRFGHYRTDWQRNESKTNLYLFSCAISCTLADYLSRRSPDFTSVVKRYPSFKRPAEFFTSIANIPYGIRHSNDNRGLRILLTEWDQIVEQICRLLVLQILPDTSFRNLPNALRLSDDHIIKTCVSGLNRFHSANLPTELLSARIKPNEGFRCQDLAWQDMITLADRYIKMGIDNQLPHVVVGSRTAGSYMAPLLKVYLEFQGFTDINWITIRPKRGVRDLEKKRLKKLLSPGVRVILIDDYANTGNTFQLLEKIISSYGVPSKNTLAMAPVHPVLEARFTSKDDIEQLLTTGQETQLITLYQSDLYLNNFMKPEMISSVLQDLISDDVDKISVIENPEIEEINHRLHDHYPESFQARLKRLYEIVIYNRDGTTAKKRVLAKNVGPGWLGYHAYIAGKRLKGFVPEVIGLREGILFMEWIDGESLRKENVTDAFLGHMGSYLARRTNSLSLPEDPRSSKPYLGWGWLEILSIFKNAYHRLLGYLKYDDLLTNFKTTLRAPSILVDGRMRPDEWIAAQKTDPDSLELKFNVAENPIKIDFEHHNFGAPELDVVDPAYDLAITSFEFELSGEKEEKLIEGYAASSGDTQTLQERIFLYKLLYAKTVFDRSLHRLKQVSGKDSLNKLNHRIQWSWDFRVFTMNKFCKSLLKKGNVPVAKSAVFFIDIDGILDVEIFGFPHTTISGLEAIVLLQSNGYEIVPNTGRSSFHLRNYCEEYGFDTAICEYGSVILDMKNNREISLIGNDVADEINRCRVIIDQMDGVFTDSNYRYAVRAFRYDGNGTIGLKEDEAKKILEVNGLKRLRLVIRDADTYFVGMANDKGNATDYYRQHFCQKGETMIAVGDSLEDVFMLERIHNAFSPLNSCDEIREMAGNNQCTMVSEPTQRGLLQIVKKVIQENNKISFRKSGTKYPHGWFLKAVDEDSFQKMMIRLLTVAESSRFKRLIYILSKGL